MARNAMKYLEFSNKEQLEEFIVNSRGEMFDTIWRAIDAAEKAGEKSAEIAEISLEEEGVTIDMVSDEEDWINSLELALEYYVKNEQYETCISIKNLIERINQSENGISHETS